MVLGDRDAPNDLRPSTALVEDEKCVRTAPAEEQGAVSAHRRDGFTLRPRAGSSGSEEKDEDGNPALGWHQPKEPHRHAINMGPSDYRQIARR